MLAIENTIAGSFACNNNELLRQSGAQIVGEYKLRISHSFCLPAPMRDWDWILPEVNSHPIALMQCREFLGQTPRNQSGGRRRYRPQCRNHPTGTSDKAMQLSAPKAAAERLWHEGPARKVIETNKHNFTRFLVVADPWQVDELNRHRSKDVNKASMVFTLPHTEGSLSQVLSILSFYRINLTKIQSLPIIGREWEYQFYVDVVFDNVLRYKQSIAAITPLTKELKILGEYEDGKSNV